MSPAKKNGSAGKTPAKPRKLRKSQWKAGEEVHQVYFMKLRSGLTIKNACYFRKETTKRMSPKTETSPMFEYYASLSTFNDQFITFAFEDGAYAIYVEDLGKDQEKDKVFLRYYGSQTPAGESGDEVDSKRLMVKLSPKKEENFCLHANNKNLSLEIREWSEDEKPLPDQAFFLFHQLSTDCVSFECMSNPGTFIGVCDNHLKLIPVDHPKEKHSSKIMFKLCKI
ncbi:interleukin-33 [Dugong dugon]